MKNFLKTTILFTFFLFSSFTLKGQCEALFTFDETAISIQFTDISTSAPGDPIVSWDWDFDDGTSSNQQNPLHTFPEPDRFDVILTITTANGCTSEFEVRIEICAFTVNINQGQCDASGNIPLIITVNDIYDNAKDINILIDGVIISGSPFEIDAETPVTLNHSIFGDGLSHTIDIQSDDIETCSKSLDITVDDCSSDCFLSSMAVDISGGTTHNVNVGDDFFSPVSTTIEISDIVHFNWIGSGHSTTSDATTGPDSWNSGVIGAGSTYDVTIINPGIHPYYCIPHGGPGGSGMAGTIVANCPAGNSFTLDISFNTTQASAQGFNLYVDGVLNSGSPYSYNGTGPQSIQISSAGDGVQHTIEIEDIADPTCIISRNWTAPDCGAAPQCNLSLEAVENGACTTNDNVPVEVTITAINAGTSGFNITVDGIPDPGNPFSYSPGGATTINIQVPGNGASHNIVATDVADPACSGSFAITTTNCTIPCSITNLTASTGTSTTHTVFVEDFIFNPANITIADGDIVEWQWTGDVDHTSTSDATTGTDSWESGLLGTGSTYQSPVLSTGVHPYYCIPHGDVGGVGMSGSITVQANCTDGEVSVAISFDATGGSFNGFNVMIDGVNAGTFNYNTSGTTAVSVNALGDGLSHSIQIVDADDPTCSASTNIITPNCNASTCQLSMTATENGSCDTNDNVPVDVTVNDVGGGASGFEILVDAVSVGTYTYDASGTTVVTIDVTGDDQSHTIEVNDLDDNTCSASTSITTTNCTIPCSITNLNASTGSSTTHVVTVEDFVFSPEHITISDGDIVEWQWTGAIDHTSTSDAESGDDSWESGLLGTGATYQSPVLSTGVHPYYCIPHGDVGGVGMSGTITVQANCTDGEVSVAISFDASGGSFNGFNVLVDGVNTGTFNYDASGTTSLSVNVAGDGQSHTIQIVDSDDPSCSVSTSITTPDCNASTCQLTMSAAENGSCDSNDNAPVDVTVNDVGGGASGFEILVDAVSVGTFVYDASGTTVVTIDVIGDEQSHTIEVNDLDDNTCSASTSITTSNCVAECFLSNLNLNDVTSGNPATHTVEVKDFEFLPKDITVNVGDQIHFDWTGAIPHTATSDINTGPDVWDSGLLGQGATFDVNIQNEGVHPYYCVPHGEPGGIGMAGTITAVPPCNNGEVSVEVNFTEEHGSFSGFNLFVDGVLNPDSPFDYHPSGTNNLVINLPGDGALHTISIEDVEDSNCSVESTIQVTSCETSEPCSLALDAVQNGDCDVNNQIPVDLSINVQNAGSSFNVFVDGNLYNGSPFNYNASNPTALTINITGTGTDRLIEIQDVDSSSCIAAVQIMTPLCGPICEVLNLEVTENLRHFIEVKDFEFLPATLDVLVGDTIEFFWTGVIPHTVTSDATSGLDVWASDLLGEGASYEVIVQESGAHPYYCIPHGGPGGIGMAGTINATENCENGIASMNLSFETTNGSPLGYNIFLDGSLLSGPVSYDDPQGSNSTTINIPGDNNTHLITVQDLDVEFCAATASFQTPFCEVLCEIQDLNAATGENLVQIIEVKDFEFEPQEVTLRTGEAVRFVWTGEIPHTATTDALAGADAWDSGLLGQGGEYGQIIYTEGEHPYYCIPHGGPGGIGMAGNIHAIPNCENGEVTVEISFNISSGSPNGYNIFVDGNPIPENPISYDDPMGANSHLINLPGDGQTHLITIQDLDVSFCAATTQVEVIDCSATCDISNANIEPTQAATHVVEVRDFDFSPQNINIALGDTVRFVWTGVIPHTATSDATSGTDSWDSELLEEGAIFDLVLTTEGEHPYYCVPHGGPVGIGMAGSINVVDNNCQNGLVSMDLVFNSEAGSPEGYNIYVDNVLDPGGPYPYDGSGTNMININVPGDGLSHFVMIQDAVDENCTEMIEIISPNCNTNCNLTAVISETGICDSEGFIPYEITIEHQFTSSGFNLLLDGSEVAGSPFNYEGTSPTILTIDVPGDGLNHQIEIIDVDSVNCNVMIEMTTEDCSPDCLVELSAIQTGNCDDIGNVLFDFMVNVENQSDEGFELQVDGITINGSPFVYDGNITTVSLGFPGDGMEHELIVFDLGDTSCNDTITIAFPDCSESCLLSDLMIEVGVPTVHEIEVRDFDFEPQDITIELGDTVRWIWTGVIPHTSTSDTLSGDDSWDSGLLGEGSVYEFVIQNTGTHPYYCVPHGAPGGVGMAGSITVIDPCDDDVLNVQFSFSNQNSGISGYNVLLDGTIIPESPLGYSVSEENLFSTAIPADGQMHSLLIQDIDDPSCQLDTIFEMPACDDPCFDFEAIYVQEIDHQNLEAQFFCQSPGVIAWSWDFGNGDTANIQNPIQIFAEEGTYEVCVEIENADGCIASFCDSITIGIYECEPDFNFEHDGLTVNFFDQSNTSDTITNWTWNYGNGILQVGVQNPIYTFDTLGVYEVCLTIEAGDCISDTCMILDLSDPCLAFHADFSFTINEENNSLQLVDISEGLPNQWLWGFGDTNTSNEQNPEHYYDEPGAYNVCLLIQETDLGCNSSYCQVVYVNTTSTNEPNRNLPLIIYPNPVASQNIQWTVSGILENDFNRQMPFKIYDISGKTLVEKVISGSEQMTIKIGRSLARSIYFIELKGENGVYRAKVIVQ